MNRNKILELSINKLGVEFGSLDLTFHKMPEGRTDDLTSYWPGGDNEDVMVCVFKGKEISEPFHRQDFFFINYAYQNSYEVLSARYDNLITIHVTLDSRIVVMLCEAKVRTRLLFLVF